MFRVQVMQPKDFAFAVELANTMNWNMTAEDFQFSKILEPKGCFTLFEDAEPVGVATCVSFGRVGWFGNLIVQSNCRSKGAGTHLVQHAVNYLKSIGVETVGLYAYKHLVPFYNKQGFAAESEFVVLKANKIFPVKAPKMQRAKEKDILTILELDSRCFGASRQKLLQPQLESGNPCFASFIGKDVAGFATARVHEGFAEVGPLVCKRSHAKKAEELLQSVLGELQGLEGWIIVPASEKELLQVAFAAGFSVEFAVVRMFLGSACAEDCVYIAESLERG
jgi:hypothetical protein